MVAAGVSTLMAASEGNSLNGIGRNSIQREGETIVSRNHGVQRSQGSGSAKKDAISVSSDVASKRHKNSTSLLEKTNSRLVSRLEGREGSKSPPSSTRTTPVRETKASRLRAASIVSPNDSVSAKGSPWSRRSGERVSETLASSRLHPTSASRTKERSPMSSDSSSATSVTRERDKSYKRKSYLNRSLNTEAVPPEQTSDSSDRWSRRLSSRRNHATEVISSPDSTTSRRSPSNSQRKYPDAKDVSSRKVTTPHIDTGRSKTHASSSTTAPIASSSGMKSSSTQRTSGGGHDVSEVSRRVDALTALTRATMERVERLTSSASPPASSKSRSVLPEVHTAGASPPSGKNRSALENLAISVEAPPPSPSKSSILKKSSEDNNPPDIIQPAAVRHNVAPVSILKHKTPDGEAGQSASSNSSHSATQPVTFCPSVIEPLSKRHGILKKRSSLDESEILRRRSCSPDVSFAENSGNPDFRPILKNQRRSSLDEIIRRAQSPDPHPTSILKRKSSREDDSEERQAGSPEPQGILKRKSANGASSAGHPNHHHHHVSITVAVMKAAASGAEVVDNSGGVRPILKKKHSREESSSSDPSSLEPRPILKKKSSTESDELDDKPKKTILKCSRKSSQEESTADGDVTSPKKLSVLRNRSAQGKPSTSFSDCDANVRPILKQSSSSCSSTRPRLNFGENATTESNDPDDSFLRKRAQSMGQAYSKERGEELLVILDKRRSLESDSLCDACQEMPAWKLLSANKSCNSRQDSAAADRQSEIPYLASTVSFESAGSFKEKKDAHQGSKGNSASLVSIESEPATTMSTAMQAKEPSLDSVKYRAMNDKREEKESNSEDESLEQEKNTIVRSNSVSQMASHFKALTEQAKAAAQESVVRRAPQKGSRGILRYRERKVQGVDRFTTQPVTYQEVQEAVLQNQRVSATAASSEAKADNGNNTDEEFDPSKLSLAERVRLFNQKIASESTPLAGGLSTEAQERSQRRRPASRYKTQPITSEEVEVASRISPFSAVLNRRHSTAETLDTPNDQERAPNAQTIPRSVISGHSDQLKSILKPPHAQTFATTRPKTPELEGFKLLKSVLKRESEEQQPVSENSDAYPRSILKADSSQKSDVADSHCEPSKPFERLSLRRNRNANTNLAKVLLDVEASTTKSKQLEDATSFEGSSKSGARNLRREKRERKERRSEDDRRIDNVDGVASVTGYRGASTLKQQSYALPTGNSDVDITDNIRTPDEGATFKSRLKQTLPSSTDETPRTSDDETSSSGGREIRSIIRNEAVHRRRQAALAKQTKHATSLSKSASHHALSSETSTTLQKSFQTSAARVPLGIPLPGLCRSATQPMPGIEPDELPSASIADRLAALQRSGTTNWKRRIPVDPDPLLSHRSRENDPDDVSTAGKDDQVIKQVVIAECVGKLESSTEGWRKKVPVSDAIKFSVAGKMKVEQSEALDTGSTSHFIKATNGNERKKKTPKPERFRGRKGIIKETASTPSSPCKEVTISYQRSFSEPATDDSGEENGSTKDLMPTVTVPRADDESFTSFFSGVSVARCENESLDLTECDFDMITSYSELLVQKRTVQTQRRRLASKNPLKTLAARTDLKTEYTEVKTGVAEKVMRSINIEKLSKNSSLAVEALAGLASTEDFSAVTLRNVSTDVGGSANKLRPHKDLMLILIKGRRHVQVRLVEPIATNINAGDNYVLVTKSEIYNYVGKYSNVIEKARGAEIALSIQQNKDLGCTASQVITISEDKPTCTSRQVSDFWKLLGADADTVKVTEAGHPDEDELYESAVIDTNMVYEITEDELVPLDKYWGAIPKIEMLDPSKILVFDFGSEMYIWNGKTASANQRKSASRLARELWEEGYDYSECTVCPINATSLIGRRAESAPDEKKGSARPEWCLLAKLTQHVETILFREKFLDWPDFSRVIRIKDSSGKDMTDGSVIVTPSDVNVMIEPNKTPVDFVLEGSHLGRGTGWYDEELMRQYLVASASVTMWDIDEFAHTLLSDSSVGQFHMGDSYIVRWTYTITVTGRELSGQPSKHSALGRDRCVYFIWQGQNASLNEQGAAALLTVELDHEEGPQIRVVQGFEPAAFLNLFDGKMVVHTGKRSEERDEQKKRLYICRGTLESEVSLVEVPCSTRQLRSRASLISLDTESGRLYIWHGKSSLPHVRQNALHAATKLKENHPVEAGLSEDLEFDIVEIEEGKEPEEFFDALGGMNKKLYDSRKSDEVMDHTPRLFHLSSVSGEFTATEFLCPHRADVATPFPFLQEELYQVNQPALFLLDNKDVLWVWQGWWPDSGDEDQTGSGAVRWQAERRAAMTMAIEYWKNIHSDATEFPVYLVWAGLEPLQFTNLFPTWIYHDDIAELNIRDGRKPGEVLTVESELARLTQSTYPPAQLLQRPLPEGVDPTRLELYLSPQHFQELLGMKKEDFEELPSWKKMKLKKEIGLF